MNKENISYPDIISRFQRKNVLVIGDFILDVYLRGNSSRLCPEAPVPVVDIELTESFPGGAANTACNLRSLGANVTYCTVIGDDQEGDESMRLLEMAGLSTAGVLRGTGRTTIVKTRIMSGGHAVTRFDKGSTNDISADLADRMLHFIESEYPRFDAIYFSDYNKGVITQRLLDGINQLQQGCAGLLVVDSKRLGSFAFLRPDLVKPNYDEVIKLISGTHQHLNRIMQVRAALPELYRKVNASMMAISLDEEGSLLVSNGEFLHRCYAHQVKNPQVSGAGDSYLSAFTLAKLAGGDPEACGEIATAAASIAIRKEATSTCTPDELISYFNLGNKLIGSNEQLAVICRDLHRQGRRIIFTNGCFDILHSGHVTYLHCVRKKGDVLIVGLNNDASISRLKGPGRPINPLGDRLQVIAGLGSVDYVVPFGNAADDTPIELIRIVRPHIFAKGGDYTKDRLPEAAIVEEMGGEIVFVPYLAERSTTRIIRQIGAAEMRTAVSV